MTDPTILVIDDETGVRRSIAAYLEDSGFRVLEATNGNEGLAIFASEAPDLVLTDLRMPGMDGVEFMKQMNAQSPQTPIIVFTGTADVQAAESLCQDGAATCLFKPITDLRILETAVRQALEARVKTS